MSSCPAFQARRGESGRDVMASLGILEGQSPRGHPVGASLGARFFPEWDPLDNTRYRTRKREPAMISSDAVQKAHQYLSPRPHLGRTRSCPEISYALGNLTCKFYCRVHRRVEAATQSSNSDRNSIPETSRTRPPRHSGLLPLAVTAFLPCGACANVQSTSESLGIQRRPDSKKVEKASHYKLKLGAVMGSGEPLEECGRRGSCPRPCLQEPPMPMHMKPERPSSPHLPLTSRSSTCQGTAPTTFPPEPTCSSHAALTACRMPGWEATRRLNSRHTGTPRTGSIPYCRPSSSSSASAASSRAALSPAISRCSPSPASSTEPRSCTVRWMRWSVTRP